MKIRPKIKLLAYQAEFLRVETPYSYAQGGVGSGKTQGGAVKALDRHVRKAGDGMIVAPTWPLLHRVTLRTYLALLQSNQYRLNKKERYIELPNGHRAYYGSADRPDTLEGSNLSWAWIDEGRYIRRSAYNIMLGRMRVGKNPELFITSTPARGWLYDEFGKPQEGRSVVRFRTRDNHHLDPGFVERLKQSLSPRLFEQYVEGEFVLATGAVFPEFSHVLHIQLDLYDPAWPVYISFDPGYRKSATLFFQRLPFCQRHGSQNCIHILDEIMPDDTATVFAMQAWKGIEARRSWRIDRVYVDPAANSKSVSLGTSDVDVIESAGYRVDWTTDPFLRTIGTGIEAIRSKLQPVSGSPSLYIDSTLADGSPRGVVRALSDSAYPEHREGHAISSDPIKDGELDHSRDALRYAIINTCPIFGASKVQVY